jgi:hypothetical protein
LEAEFWLATIAVVASGVWLALLFFAVLVLVEGSLLPAARYCAWLLAERAKRLAARWKGGR